MAKKRSAAQIAAAKKNLEKARAVRSKAAKVSAGVMKSMGKKSLPPKGSKEWYKQESEWGAKNKNVVGGAAWRKRKNRRKKK